MACLSSPSVTLVGLIETLIAEVRGLRADLARSRGADRGLTRADRDRLSRLLPAIAGAKGSDPFVARELFEPHPALRLAMRDLTPPAAGRLLHRGLAAAVDGYQVEQVGLELGVRLWRVVAVVEPPGTRSSPVPPRPVPELVK